MKPAHPLNRCAALASLCLSMTLVQVPAGDPPLQLLNNPAFTSAPGSSTPDSWEPWLPEWAPARPTFTSLPSGLKISAPDKPYAVGGLRQSVHGIQAGQHYALRVEGIIENMAHPLESLAVRVEWWNGKERLHPAGVLVRGPTVKNATAVFEDVLLAPPEATAARLSLEFKWPRGGSVTWQNASFQPGPAPSPRKAKLAVAYLRPRNSTPEKNLDLWIRQIDDAGREKADAICLSEAILLPGTSATASGIAEPIPGPATIALGAAAKRNAIWVVAGLMETDGQTLFNSAVLINRDGELAGKYRKVHLPREEWQKGITPGNDYPVFDTDFGKVGLLVCYDYMFPEATAILAGAGAEIVFFPTWGTTFPDDDGRVEGQSIFRVRARDNAVVMVPSVYDGESMIIDPLGRIVARNSGKTGVFTAEIDFALREPLWWVGHWGSLLPRHRRPDTYQPLTGK